LSGAFDSTATTGVAGAEIDPEFEEGADRNEPHATVAGDMELAIIVSGKAECAHSGRTARSPTW